jgi:hypothetical protein
MQVASFRTLLSYWQSPPRRSQWNPNDGDERGHAKLHGFRSLHFHYVRKTPGLCYVLCIQALSGGAMRALFACMEQKTFCPFRVAAVVLAPPESVCITVDAQLSQAFTTASLLRTGTVECVAPCSHSNVYHFAWVNPTVMVLHLLETGRT